MQDPRYYYIKVLSLSEIHPQLMVPQLKLTFSIGLKKSETVIKMPSKEQIEHNDGKVVLNKKFAQQAHIFKYQGEEIMHVDLGPHENIEQKQHQEEWNRFGLDKKKEKAKKHKQRDMKQSTQKEEDNIHNAFARVLLTPLIAHPHTRNHLQCHLISAASLSRMDREVSCIVECQLYFLQDFAAKMQIIPIEANLQRSVANVGEMKPYCKLQIQNQTRCSQEVEGGIHPKWNAFYSIKEDNKGRILNYSSVNTNNTNTNNANKTNAVEMSNNHPPAPPTSRSTAHMKSASNMHELMDEGLIHEFNLGSAGSELHLQVLSSPFPMAEPAVIGSAKIHMQSSGWFLHPRLQADHKFETQVITLYTEEYNQEVQAGQITVRTRFIFDKSTALLSRNMIQYLQ